MKPYEDVYPEGTKNFNDLSSDETLCDILYQVGVFYTKKKLVSHLKQKNK